MDEQGKREIPRWLWALIGLGGALLVVFALLVGPWLFTRFPHQDLTAEQELKAKNDVRTTLVQALVGLAVAGGAVVTYRTFRQNRFEQDRTYRQTRIEQDRTYERELYATAIEQLGHDQAPVRLGALYSLATLGQDRSDRRQMVVDVLCAYLRMPYAPPSESADAPPDQERQVRLTAQRLLGDHLRRPDGVSGEDAQKRPPSPDESLWPNISLDLTGAFLIDLHLEGLSAVDVRFDQAIFSGSASFGGAWFTGDAWFDNAIFTGEAAFLWATFTGQARFEKATFNGLAWFPRVTFTDAFFGKATFNGRATFDDAKSTALTSFKEARFIGDASFDGVTFYDAGFEGAKFFGGASFERATFLETAGTFTGPLFDGAQVLNFDDPDLKGRVWPNGWTVRANTDDPTRGTLVHEPPTSSLEAPDG